MLEVVRTARHYRHLTPETIYVFSVVSTECLCNYVMSQTGPKEHGGTLNQSAFTELSQIAGPLGTKICEPLSIYLWKPVKYDSALLLRLLYCHSKQRDLCAPMPVYAMKQRV